MPRFMKKKSFKPQTGRKLINKVVKTVLHRQVENKSYDVASNANTITYTGSVFNLVDNLQVGTGTAGSGRIGLKVKPMKLSLRLQIIGNPTTTINQAIRLIVFKYRHEGGSSPTVAQMLQLSGSANAYLSFYNWANTNEGQYHILYDQIHTVSGSQIQTNTSATAYVSFDKYEKIITLNFFGKKINPMMTFTSSANTIDDGGLYLLAISDTVTNGPYLSYYSRFVYEDA